MNSEQKLAVQMEIHKIPYFFEDSNKEQLFSLRESLISFVLSGEVSRKNLIEFIKVNHNTVASGFMSTVLDLTSLNFQERQEAHKIGLKEKYGFLAYKGVKVGLSLEQGIFGNFSYAKGFSGNAGGNSIFVWADGFKGDAGPNSIYEFASNFSGGAGDDSIYQLSANFEDYTGWYSRYVQRRGFGKNAGLFSKVENKFLLNVQDFLNLTKQGGIIAGQKSLSKISETFSKYYFGDFYMPVNLNLLKKRL